MLNRFGIAAGSMLFAFATVAPAMEGAPVAADASITRVETVVEPPGGECQPATGRITATYDGRQHLIWVAYAPRQLCDNVNVLKNPITIETVWTGQASVDTPIVIRGDLTFSDPNRSAHEGSMAFWFYPYGPDGDCVTKQKQTPGADVAMLAEVKFCA